MRRWVSPFALALAAILGLAVLFARTRSEKTEGRLPRASGLDVVLVSVDTLRADALGA